MTTKYRLQFAVVTMSIIRLETSFLVMMMVMISMFFVIFTIFIHPIHPTILVVMVMMMFLIIQTKTSVGMVVQFTI